MGGQVEKGRGRGLGSLSQESPPAVTRAVRIWDCAAAVGPHRGVSLPGLSYCPFPTPPLPPALSLAHLRVHFGSGRPPRGPQCGAGAGAGPAGGPRTPATGTCGADCRARSGPVKGSVPGSTGHWAHALRWVLQEMARFFVLGFLPLILLLVP